MRYQCEFQNEYFQFEDCKVTEATKTGELRITLSQIIVQETCHENAKKKPLSTGEACLLINDERFFKAIRMGEFDNGGSYMDIPLKENSVLEILRQSEIINCEKLNDKQIYMLVFHEPTNTFYGLYFEFEYVQMEWEEYIDRTIYTPNYRKIENEWVAKLDWRKPPEIQEAAMAELQNLEGDGLFDLIMPYSKTHWENAALVIKKIGYPKIKSIISQLFGWIEDMCWPGATVVFALLKTIPKSELKEPLASKIDYALHLEDETLVYNLYEIIHDTNQSDDFVGLLTLKSKKDITRLIRLIGFAVTDQFNVDFVTIKRILGTTEYNRYVIECLKWLLEIAERAGITQVDFKDVK